ncbi:hypothetical protein [Streptomyces sp. NRRL B-24085]|uniref:hypothetical protein n=1 Tax=Streptomyces sp. NRRL B-24085 TaxID=1709476 RepID=UPI000AAEF978|nr:hypothetical protein [Streptomyces sp. NRRL B-24085]
MTFPEENRPKTTSTDHVIETPDEKTSPHGDGATGRTLREALEEAGISPDDVRAES